MSAIAEDVVAELEEAGSFDAVVARLDRLAEQLAADMVDGQVLPRAEAELVRAAVLRHLRDEVIPAVTPHRGLRVLDTVARRGLHGLEPLRAALVAARHAGARPPRVPDWPELAALRSLPPAEAQLAPGITDAAFAQELADRGAPVPAELLALYAASDGLTLRNRDSGVITLGLWPSTELHVVRLSDEPREDAADDDSASDDVVGVRIGRWSPPPFGFTREHTELWIARGRLGGGYERSHPGQARVRLRFGDRSLDVRAMLRFALAQVEARAENAGPPALRVPALQHELSWRWFLADDDERFELLASGRPAAARAHAERMIADLADDEASCTRVGDHGAASKAERERERWEARLRTLA